MARRPARLLVVDPRGYQVIKVAADPVHWELRCTRGGERSLGLFAHAASAFQAAELDMIERENLNILYGIQGDRA